MAGQFFQHGGLRRRASVSHPLGSDISDHPDRLRKNHDSAEVYGEG
jgi:hypothetical protein